MIVLASWIPMGGSVAGRPAVPRGMLVWWLAVEEPEAEFLRQKIGWHTAQTLDREPQASSLSETTA
jgi:hypothetical protein